EAGFRSGTCLAHRLPDRPLPDHLLRDRLVRAADARNRARLHAALREAAYAACAGALELVVDFDTFVEPVHFPGVVRIAPARQFIAQFARTAIDVDVFAEKAR